jgi:hypothetical protein
MAVQPGDHRLRAGLDRAEAAPALAHHLEDLVLRVGRGAVHPAHRAEVGADAEVAVVGALQHHHPAPGIRPELLEGLLQLAHQVRRDRVVAVARHHHPGHRAFSPDLDQLAHQAVKRGMPPATSIAAPVM